MWDGWMHGGGWVFGMGFGFLVWVLLAVVLILALRSALARPGERTPDPGRTEPRETPLEILQKRYARGDISREEYEQKRKDLS